MAGKRVVKKKAEVEKPKKQTRATEVKMDDARNHQAKASKDASLVVKKPKIHAKVLQMQISVGTYDRKRLIEDFQEFIEKKIGKVPYGEEGVHASVTGAYYILDGAVCLPEDYDPKTGTFKKGATPPQWAGGPKPQSSTQNDRLEQMAKDARELSSDEYDKKYKIGKYLQLGTPGAKLITPEDRKRAKMEALRKEEEALEEIDMEEMEDEADKQTKKAIKVLKNKPVKKTAKKVVVKKGKK